MFIKLRGVRAPSKRPALASVAGAGLDPGNVNVGYCLWSFSEAGIWRIHKIGLGMENPVRGLKKGSDVKTAFSILHSVFLDDIKSLKAKKRICAGERFLARGRFGGSLAEVANFQLAALAATALYADTAFETFGAAEWKNAFQRLCKADKKIPNLKEWYVSAKSVHNIDALFIGLYSAGLLHRALTCNAFREVFNAAFFLPNKRSPRKPIPRY